MNRRQNNAMLVKQVPRAVGAAVQLLSCGVGQEREPIYAVDQQGRIIRTLQRRS